MGMVRFPASHFARLRKVEVNVLTQNTWLKPGITGTDRTPRVERLCRVIQGYDIVGLQETFSDDAQTILDRARYPYAYRKATGNGITLNCGLSILSRHPIMELEFQKFTEGVGPDFWVQKGVLFTRLDLPDFGPIDVFNTHVQAEDDQASHSARLSNINELIEFVLEKYAGNPTLLLGDYNADYASRELEHLRRRLSVHDAFRLANPRSFGHTYVPSPLNPYNETTEPSRRLDYIFILPTPNVRVQILGARVVNDRPVKGFMLSDHFGVATRLRICNYN